MLKFEENTQMQTSQSGNRDFKKNYSLNSVTSVRYM